MPTRSSKKSDHVELSVRSPMMGSKSNGEKKKSDDQRPLKMGNKGNGANTKKNDGQRKTMVGNKENGGQKKNDTQRKSLSKENGAKKNGDQKSVGTKQNSAKLVDQRKHLNGNNQKNSGAKKNTNGDKRTIDAKTKGTEDQRLPMMGDKENESKKKQNYDENENSTKSRHKKTKKRVFMICLFILILVSVLSILIAVLVWKFTMDAETVDNVVKDTSIKIDVDIHLNRSYTADYADESSAAHKHLAKSYITEINQVFEDGKLSTSYLFSIVNQFRPGSVIVSSSSYFSNEISASYTEEEYLRMLKSDIENELLVDVVNGGALGSLADVENAVLVKQPVVVTKTPSMDGTQLPNAEPTNAEEVPTKETPKVSDPDPNPDPDQYTDPDAGPDIEESDVCGVRPGMRRRRKRVVGGINSPFGSMPWIGSVRKSPEGHYCAATLINSRWAVTAAHCLGNTDHVVFGDLYLDWPSDYEEMLNLSAVFPHPDYDFYADRADKPNDIALLRLSRPVKISPAISPACLATNHNELHEYRECTAAGWGISDYRGINTNRLQEVLLPLVPMNDCRTFYAAESPGFMPDVSSVASSQDLIQVNNTSVVTDTMICAGGYPEGGKGVCRADSGGPLVCLGEDDLWYLVGVGSWSWGCDLPNIPNVFARVSVFNDFIHDTIKQTEDCIKDESKTSCFEGCVGGEDCLKQCDTDDFRCQAGYCIPGEKACNNQVDCADGSDERGYAGCLDDCGDSNIVVQPGSQTTIQSPGYPVVYPDFHRCQWQITASGGGRVLVNFTEFDLEGDYDFLHVGIGLGSSDYLFSLTGSQRQLDLISPESELVLTFSTDISTGLKGFSLLVTEISVTEFDACNNGVQVVPSDRDIFCDDNSDCADNSDEPPSCFNAGSRNLCGRDSVLVSATMPVNISFIDYTSSAYCKWVVNAESPSSRLRIHFLKFELESNYDYLLVSNSLDAEAPKLSYTGQKIPPDIVSPGPSFVITFETDDTGVDYGFLLQVSLLQPTDDSVAELRLCANDMEVIPDGGFCSGSIDCQDGSDEVHGCECGDHVLNVPSGGSLTLTSFNYPQRYHKSILCEWTVRTESQRKMTITFSDFSLEENYDFLHIGTAQQPKLLRFTGRNLPLDIVSPDEEILITFETDHSISDRGFSMLVNDSEATGNLQFCDNGIEVISSGKGRQKCHN